MDSQTLKPNVGDLQSDVIAIRIVRAAFREIQKLSHQYSETVAEILKQMSQGNLGDRRKLEDYTDLLRTKQGDVRVIWEWINSQEILVIKAGLRRDVYQGVIEDRDRNPTYTLANLMGIEESQVEDIPTFNFNVNKTRDLILFRAFVLARDEIYQSRHPNYHENIRRLEFLIRNINLSRWEERLGHKKSWLQGVKEITESAYPVEDRNTTIFILDEVQDYLRYEITAIIGMLERWQNHYQHNSILWLLGDKNQNIMPTDFDWGQLELTRTNSLRYNYRNTKCIIEFANIFHSFTQVANSGGRHLPQPSNPEDCFEKGELVKILEFSSEEQALQILTKLSKKIINTSSSNQRSLLREISSRVKVICKDIPEKYKNLPGIDYLNVQQAKGREFDGCVAFYVLGGEGNPSFEEATSWYTTFTRPRYRLLVIATTEEINRIGRDKFNKCEPIQISNIDEPLKWITEFANGEQILRNTEGVRNIIYQSLSSKLRIEHLITCKK
jgi:mRNA-degrading endonuclease RelE of RelBE toxin-antitoxin system